MLLESLDGNNQIIIIMIDIRCQSVWVEMAQSNIQGFYLFVVCLNFMFYRPTKSTMLPKFGHTAIFTPLQPSLPYLSTEPALPLSLLTLLRKKNHHLQNTTITICQKLIRLKEKHHLLCSIKQCQLSLKFKLFKWLFFCCLYAISICFQ